MSDDVPKSSGKGSWGLISKKISDLGRTSRNEISPKHTEIDPNKLSDDFFKEHYNDPSKDDGIDIDIQK